MTPTARNGTRAKKDLRKDLQRRDPGTRQGDLLSEEDAGLLDIVSRFEVGPSEGPPVTAPIPEECERLRRELREARAELERLRRETSRAITSWAVQPSSMIYYDLASHRRLPGPASVVYYPAGPAPGASAELPRPPDFVPPTPAPCRLPDCHGPEAAASAAGEAAAAAGEGSRFRGGGPRLLGVGYRKPHLVGPLRPGLAGFDSAVRLDDEDGRFWYYKALAERRWARWKRPRRRRARPGAARRPEAEGRPGRAAGAGAGTGTPLPECAGGAGFRGRGGPSNGAGKTAPPSSERPMSPTGPWD